MTRRVTIAASEVLGMQGTGGAATADSLLALALARHGHDVELLVAPGRAIEPLAEPWASLYESRGIRVRRLEQRTVVRPGYLAPTLAVLEAVRASRPDVLVADDWRGLGWASLQARRLARGLDETAVVLYCHGPARMLAEFAQKVPDTLARFGEEVAERASLELADAAISPSTWLFEWQRERGWPAPRASQVVPCLWRSVALGEEQTPPPPRARIRRLAFFGQLREGKGVRIFVESLDSLGDLLDGVEVLFLGRETPRWTADRVRGSLAPATLDRVGSLRFETGLDPGAALVELRVPGTLAVIPSLLDNSPYTVSECIESGVPFVAARTGGIPELVAVSDRDRILFEPDAVDLTRTLRHVLGASDGHAAAAPGFDPDAALATWLELVEDVRPVTRPSGARIARVDVVATGLEGALDVQGSESEIDVRVIASSSRQVGVERSSAEWVLLLDERDRPEPELLPALVEAQAASGADIVTAAARPEDEPTGVQLFLGEPGALGLVENQYGVIALARRDLVAPVVTDGAVDPDWPLLASLSLAGARIVSVPDPLSRHSGRPGTIADVPGDGLRVLRLFESTPAPAGTPALAATLAAAILRGARRDARVPGTTAGGVLRRSVRVLREGGLGAGVRAARSRLTRRD